MYRKLSYSSMYRSRMGILISSLYPIVLANGLYVNLNLDAIVEDRLVFNVRISVISNLREFQRL